MNKNDDNFIPYWGEKCECTHTRAMHFMKERECATPTCTCKKYAIVKDNGTETPPAE